MGLIIWYKVVIEEKNPTGGLLTAAGSLLGLGLPVKASNDVFGGSLVLDADIQLDMKSGASASTFQVKLLNLPKDLIDKIMSKQREGLAKLPPEPLQVKVFLSYFEELPTLTATDPVMEGAVRRIRSEVNAAGQLELQLYGEELGGYQLRTKTRFEHALEQASVSAVLEQICQGTVVRLEGGHGLAAEVKDYTLTGANALVALGDFAEKLRLPVIIRDQKLFVKNSVGAGDPIATFSANDNLVSQAETQENEEISDAPEPASNEASAATARTGHQVVVLGNPKLRAGQIVKLKLPDDREEPYRIVNVVHRFSNAAGGGYTCVVLLVDAQPGAVARAAVGVEALADTLQDNASRARRAANAIGEVVAYTPGGDKHVATLNYGQSPADGTVRASVQAPVDDTVQQRNRPILAPFAFHKTGMLVPVYPKMRALLAHNLGQVNDAIVTGFLWPDDPAYQRPKSEAGDYWLCLPTQVGGDGMPTGKGVNDLIDASGRRVIQAKGVHLLVGEDLLSDVGERPTVPDGIADQIIIEHASGTTIRITKDGAVKIETSNKEISMTNGAVTLKLNGAAVEVS